MQKYNPVFKNGDRVAYSAQWLQSTGQITGEIPGLRGTVKDVLPLSGGRSLVTVKWDAGWQVNVLNVNLAKLGSPAMSIN